MYLFSISTHQSTMLLSFLNSKGILHSLSSESFTLVKMDARAGMKFCRIGRKGESVEHSRDLLIIGGFPDDSEARDILNSTDQI